LNKTPGCIGFNYLTATNKGIRMGAWGCGIFEDDSVLDSFDELMESDPITYLSAALNKADDGYIDYENGAAIILSAAVIDSLLSGTNHDPNSDDFIQWVNVHKDLDITSLIPVATKGLEMVIGGNSELNELWQENEKEYSEWKSNLESIINRLSKK
jgi:hypothetical protein